jgi:hypothetical protein
LPQERVIGRAIKLRQQRPFVYGRKTDDTARVDPLPLGRREAQSGSCAERENLAGDAKGQGASGSNREAESTDAPERGGLPRSSDEAG